MAKGFSWKVWCLKVAKAAAFVVLAGLASVYGESTWYLALAPALVGFENYWKHK